jgi:hypothetical protein
MKPTPEMDLLLSINLAADSPQKEAQLLRAMSPQTLKAMVNAGALDRHTYSDEIERRCRHTRYVARALNESLARKKERELQKAQGACP